MLGTIAVAMMMQAAATTDVAAPADYGLEQNWLCYPGRRDTCSAEDYTATRMDSGAAPARVDYKMADDPGVDCFYVYPTVSLDQTPNSDLVANDEERYVVEAQFARFGSVCRTFAPIYRQFTIPALRAAISGQPMQGDMNAAREMAYDDVKAAFDYYMSNENGGRPYIVYGHSQGTMMLKKLIAEEIEGKPAAANMLGAYLLGINVGVTPGSTTGEFQTPLCTQPGQTGCIVTWVTFREDDPPGANARFSRWTGEGGYQVACTDPAALAGKSGLRSAFPTRQANDLDVSTPYLVSDDLIRGKCVSDNGASYLQVTYDPDRKDMGEAVFAPARGMTGWGLHMVDANVAQDTLIAFAKSQAEAYKAANGDIAN